MPVRSLSSSVLRWPKRSEVDAALRLFAVREARRRPDLILLGYFGSYARDDAGVGSDLDIVAVLQSEDRPFERRAVSWDTSALPVPADLLIYTFEEWQSLLQRGGQFAATMQTETVWVYARNSEPSA